MRRRDIVAAAAGAVVATVLAGGVAWAAIPGPGGVIQGCYDSGGNVKVVEALPCPKGYTPLQWNQQGLRGDPGPAGAAGEQGPPGAQGPEGVKGAKGDPGNLALAGRSCASGSFVTGFDSSGDLVCAEPSSSPPPPPPPSSGELLISPSQLVFPETQTGALSTAMIVNLTNTGSANIAVPITVAGANPGDFILDDGCNVSVPAQGTCALSVQFAPSALGERTAVILLQRPTGDIFSVSLSGTGV